MLIDKREVGRVSRFSVKQLLSHSAETFRMGTRKCVTSFGYGKNLCLRKLCHIFLWKFFCLTVQKFFIGDSFSVSIISGIKKS